MKGPAMIGGDHCLAPERTVDAAIDDGAGRYVRLFPDLRPIEEDNAVLLALGVAGGVCDAGGPQARTAGIVNFRTPRVNLESLYGSGQIGSPYLFRADDPDHLTDLLVR
jgi:hypothetical protein